MEPGSESARTVLVAGAANLAIAAAKGVGGWLSGSAAMLSEAVHSVADTTTEVLLFVALRWGRRAPDRAHPFGFGRAAFVWALTAAGFTFVAGGGFAVTHGIHTIRDGEVDSHVVPSLVVLVAAFGIESVSLAQGLRQARGEAAPFRTGVRRYLRYTSNTAVKAVVLEDLAALAGLVLAAAGLVLTAVTGSAVWDGVASVLIGVLLVGVAASLIRSNASWLIGQGVPAGLERLIREELRGVPAVEAVPELFTSVIGMSQVLVAARVRFAVDATTESITAAAEEAERRLMAAVPAIRYVFLDPTPGPSDPDSGSGR